MAYSAILPIYPHGLERDHERGHERERQQMPASPREPRDWRSGAEGENRDPPERRDVVFGRIGSEGTVMGTRKTCVPSRPIAGRGPRREAENDRRR